MDTTSTDYKNQDKRARSSAKSGTSEGGLFVFEFTRVVRKSKLDKRFKHLLTELALAADGVTGIGISGIQTIADDMSCSYKYVQELLKELDALPDAPVRVLRKKRYTKEGHRSSDEYTLVVVDPGTNGTQSAVSEGGDQRHETPILTAREGGTNGTLCAEDQISLDHIDQISIPLRGKKTSSDGWVPDARELKRHYVTEFVRLRSHGSEPRWGKLEPRAMKAFADLVDVHGLEAAKRIVTNALARDPKYTPSVEPWDLAARANNYLVAPVAAEPATIEWAG
jgi:hypothetical protein